MVCFVGVERVFVRWTRTVSVAMLLPQRKAKSTPRRRSAEKPTTAATAAATFVA
jgi:hypothetical protein